jgi:acyl-CoA hydrolase
MIETTSHIVMSKDLNSYGTLFGGKLISWMDELALILSVKHTGMECVTTSFNNIKLKKSVFIHDVLEITAEIKEIKKCSLYIDINVHRIKKNDNPEYIAGGNVVFVALDENKKLAKIK